MEPGGRTVHRHREYDTMTFIDFLLQPTRVVMINDILSLNLPLRFALLYVPMFQNFYQLFTTLKNQLMQIPLSGLGMLNQSLGGAPRFIRQLAGCAGLYMGFFLYWAHGYVTEKVVPSILEKEDQRQNRLDWLFYSQILCLISFILFYLSSPGSTGHNWTHEQVSKLQAERPEFSTPRCLCLQCQKPKVARSQHCQYCQICVPKFVEHSMIANICIGAANYLQYLFFIFCTSNYLLQLLLSILATKKKDYLPGINQLIILIFLFFLCKHFFLESICQINLALHNMTTSEVRGWQRLPYLWKSELREFDNIFNLGVCGNLFELLVPYIQGPIESSQTKASKNQSYDQLDQDIEMSNVNSYQEDEGIEFYKGKYINWLNAKYYTVMDIPLDHPMKLRAYKELQARGAMDASAKTEKEMKESWKKYMKKQLQMQEQQQKMYQQQMQQMKAQFSSASNHHQHGPGCSHEQGQTAVKQQSQVQSVDPENMTEKQKEEFRRQTQNEIKEMMQKKVQMFQNHQQGMQMEQQEDVEESGGLLDDKDE